ncbi:MAG: sigma-70 family RNA polymerase sigma factor [Planctomycetota bacterium]
MTEPSPNHDFETTHWSMVASSREHDSEVRRESLEQLCNLYWYPLFAFLRRKGYDPDSATDLVQGFLAELIEKKYLDDVSPAKGRFRWFLMSAVKRYASRQIEKQKAIKRGGGRIVFSLNVEDAEKKYQLEPAENLTAEKLFDRNWALTILQQAVENLRNEFESKGRLEFYEATQMTLSGVSMTQAEYQEIADRFQTTPNAVKVSAMRLRQKYRESIRLIVAQTLENGSNIDDEIEDLFRALSGE